MKKVIRFVLVIIAVLSFTVHAAAAHDLTDYMTDSSTQWSFVSSYNYHSGTKTYTYKFKTSNDESKYGEDITNGAGLWGSYINISYSSDSKQGNIYSEKISDTNVLATALDQKTSMGHYKSWGIRINSTKYDQKDDAIKKHVIAHELGHVYGLGHYSDKSSIMYDTVGSSNCLSAVSSSDKTGMDTMTHEHTHTSASYDYERDYSEKGQSIHKKRCTTCKAYVEEAHTLSSGKCQCGFVGTSS